MNLKLKYHYKVQHLLESYPTPEDALFEITTFLREKGASVNDEFTESIKIAFHGKIDDGTLLSVLNHLISTGHLAKRESGKKVYYRIISTPF